MRSIARLPSAPPTNVRQFRARRVAQHVDEEQAVGGRGVAGAEHHARAGAAVDVRHAEGAVALDRRRPSAGFRSSEVAFFDAEGRVLEVVGDLFVRERRGAVDQVGVQRKLVCEVRRVGAFAAGIRRAARRCRGRSRPEGRTLRKPPASLVPYGCTGPSARATAGAASSAPAHAARSQLAVNRIRAANSPRPPFLLRKMRSRRPCGAIASTQQPACPAHARPGCERAYTTAAAAKIHKPRIV